MVLSCRLGLDHHSITWETYLVCRNANRLHLPLISVEELPFCLTIRIYQTEHSNLVYCLAIPFSVFRSCQANLEVSNTEQDQWGWTTTGQSNTENVSMEQFTWAVQLLPLSNAPRYTWVYFTHPSRQWFIQPSKLLSMYSRSPHANVASHVAILFNYYS